MDTSEPSRSQKHHTILIVLSDKSARKEFGLTKIAFATMKPANGEFQVG